MKAHLGVDVDGFDLGPGSGACRAILRAWNETDWLVPGDPDGHERARALLVRHAELARAWLPEPFPSDVRFARVVGDVPTFAAITRQIRSGASAWDWKFAALKPLVALHAKAAGWTREAQAARYVDGSDGPMIALLPTLTVWNLRWSEWSTESIDAASRDAVRWYASYAEIDLVDALEWQLADATDEVRANPFVPLLEVYALGCYPFSFGPRDMTLFSFGRPVREPVI